MWWLLACSENVDPSSTLTDVFVQGWTTEVDVLLVVDDAPSMVDAQARLAEAAPDFVDALAPVDWHLGVITTSAEADDPDAGVLLGDPPVLDRTVEDAADALATRAQMGADGTEAGEGLAAALLALSPPLSETRNAGFRRDDADLAVLVVSDHDDAGTQDVDAQVAAIDGTVSAIVPDDAARYASAVEATAGILEPIDADLWTFPSVFAGDLWSRFQLSRHPDLSDAGCPFRVEIDEEPVTEGWSVDACDDALVFDDDAIPARGSKIIATYCVADTTPACR